jgi:hypothetical protein
MSFSIELVDESLSYPYDDPAAPCASGVLILSESNERLGKTYQHNRILLSPRVRSLASRAIITPTREHEAPEF